MKKTIESIQKQSLKDFDVWIIDGGSKIETQEYLKTLSEPYFFISEKDKGIYDAMNKGIQKSKGDWLYFLGSGDILENKTVLERVFSKTYSNDVSLISGNIIYSGETVPFIYSKNKNIKKPSWNLSIWIRNGLHHQGTFYKRALFKQINYNIKYPILSDYWFNILLYKNKKKCILINTLIAKCNSEGVSKVGNWNCYKEEINLKTDLSSIFLFPLFLILAFTKYFSRQMIND